VPRAVSRGERGNRGSGETETGARGGPISANFGTKSVVAVRVEPVETRIPVRPSTSSGRTAIEMDAMLAHMRGEPETRGHRDVRTQMGDGVAYGNFRHLLSSA